jgi:hypothetical protein
MIFYQMNPESKRKNKIKKFNLLAEQIIFQMQIKIIINLRILVPFQEYQQINLIFFKLYLNKKHPFLKL